MALLVGDSSTAAYTTNTFTNFGGHAANSGATLATAAGTVSTCAIYVNSWGSTTSIRLALYEGASAATADDLVATFLYTSAQGSGEITAAPEAAASITSGLYYRIKYYFDPASAESDIIQLWRDGTQTIAGGQGISTSLTGSFASPDDPLNTAELTNEQQDGLFYFNVDGTATPSGNTGTLSETQDGNTSTASGGVEVQGTLSESQDSNTLSASGSIAAGVTGSLSEAQEDNTATTTGLVWQPVTFAGPAPDIETTESFYELAINDLGFTAEVGDILYFTINTGLTVDGQWIPTVDPASDVTGFYYIYDTSLASFTATQAYTIDQRYSGEVVEVQDSNTVAASGSVVSNITASLSETQEDNAATSSGSINTAGTLSETQEANTSAASGILTVVGTTSAIQAGDSVSAAGLAGDAISGTTSEVQDSNSLASAGAITHTGSLSEVQSSNTSTTSSGVVGDVIVGSSNLVEQGNTSVASGGITLIGLFSESQDSQTLAAAGSLAQDVDGSLSVSQSSDTLSAAGSIALNITASLSEVQDNNTSEITTLVGNLGSASNTQEDNTSTGSGVANIFGSVSETQEANTSTASGLLTVSGVVSEVEEGHTLSAGGLTGLIGSASEVQDANSLSSTGNIALNISGSLSAAQSSNSLSSAGTAGLSELIDSIVAAMIIWLPENNVLTEVQMASLVVPIINSVGSTEADEPEILCKALKSAAYVNKAKASTHYALTKEKVRDGEYNWSTGGKAPKELWQDYIDELSTLCPLFGYTGSPSSIGIKVNSGPTINPLKNCPTSDYPLY